MLVINPEDCIDCGLCIPVCPENAIYSDEDIPSGEEIALEINERMSNTWPNIAKKKPPLPDAEHWSTVQNKWSYLIDYDGMPCVEYQHIKQE